MQHVDALFSLPSVALPVQRMQPCWLQSPMQVTHAQHMLSQPFKRRCLCIQVTAREAAAMLPAGRVLATERSHQ